MDPKVGRPLSMFDAMILVGLTAVASARLPTVGPQAREVFRRLDLGHVREDGFPGRNFQAWPQTSRMDSMGLLARGLIRPIFDRDPPGLLHTRPGGPRLTRQEWLENWAMTRTNSRSGDRAAGYAAASEAYVLAFPFLIFWTIGMMILRLRKPRPDPAVLWRQPGWCASVAVVVAVALGLAEEALIGWDAYTILVPASVLIAWIILFATRKWSAEASWIDRLGRLLGLAWLALIPLYVVGFAIPYFK